MAGAELAGSTERNRRLFRREAREKQGNVRNEVKNRRKIGGSTMSGGANLK
jgi:hypothetical protein